MKRLIDKLVIVGIAAALCGCAWSRVDEVEPTLEGTRDLGDRIETTFSVPMPQIYATRTLADADENAIRNIYVLVFKVDGDAEYYDYTTRATDLSTNGAVSFKVQLRKSAAAEKYRLVFVANLTEPLEVGAGAVKSVARTEATFSTLHTFETGTHAIPMWSESPLTTAITSTTTADDFGTIHFLRSMAKVKVTNTDPNFILEGARVWNAPDAGLIAPLVEHYDSATNTVTAPSVPAHAGIILGSTFPMKAAVDNVIDGEIYIAEAAKKAALGDAHAVYLVLQGKYGSASAPSTFYRVDFAQGGEPIDILRNVAYGVTITNIGGGGMASENDAATSVPINGFGATVTAWDGVEVDPYVETSFSSETVRLPKTAGAASARYVTSYTEAPVVTLAQECDWITAWAVDAANRTINIAHDANNTLADRTTTFTLKLGLDTYTIDVVQAGHFVGGGAGTADDPYLITSLVDLEEFRDKVNSADAGAKRSAYYRQTADIDMGTKYNSTTGVSWTPIGDYSTDSTLFRGKYDGGGHAIRNIYINNPTANYQGLFGYGYGSNFAIYDLSVVGGSVTGQQNVGAIIGSIYTGTNSSVINCYNSAAVNGTRCVGGIAGYVESNVVNCINAGTVNGAENTGGIAGIMYVSSNYLSNCINIGSVSGTANVGAVLGNQQSCTIAACYYLEGSATVGETIKTGTGYPIMDFGGDSTPVSAAVLAGEQDFGEVVSVGNYLLTNLVDMLNTGAYIYNNPVSGTAPAVKARGWTMEEGGGSHPVFFGNTKPAAIASSARSFGGGNGTKAEPFEIADLDDLELLADVSKSTKVSVFTFTQGYYLQTADIDMGTKYNSTTGTSWTPIGDYGGSGKKIFRGKYDGGGHAIRNIYINRPNTDYQGLFGYANSGPVQNIIMEGGQVIGKNRAGAIAGCLYSSTLILKNCHNRGVAVTAAHVAGGVIGYMRNSEIVNCSNSGTVVQTYNESASDVGAGGIVGNTSSGKVINCYNSGTVSGEYQQVGGIAGDGGSSTIRNCLNTAVVNGADIYVGSIVGQHTTSQYINNYYLAGSATDGNSFTQNAIGADTLGKSVADVAYETTAFTDEQIRGNATISPALALSADEGATTYTALIDMLNAGAAAYNTANPTLPQAFEWSQTVGNYPALILPQQ